MDGFVVAHPLDSDACPHRAGVAQSACERTSIDSLYSGNSMLKEKIMKISLRAPVTRQRAQLFNDEAAHLRHFTFDVEQVGPVISDEGISHRHDLASVGGIGKHLLVAGHGRVEADFARLRSRRTKRLATKNRFRLQVPGLHPHAHDRRSRAVLKWKWRASS